MSSQEGMASLPRAKRGPRPIEADHLKKTAWRNVKRREGVRGRWRDPAASPACIIQNPDRVNFRFGRPAAERRPERFYSTSTTARIQGWMQHWNLCTPGESPLIWTVLPGATTTGDVRQAPAWTNGTVPAGPPTPLRNGTNPPPNAATSVNVWPSPPAFVARTVCPARIEIYPGAKFHAGCPMTFAASGENSSPMNSAKGVSSLCGVAAHVPGPMAALKVVGSQLSTNATLGSLLLT
jgi:hypothetical protein